MFDFDKIVDRRESNSYKWDIADGELPMWVADMDFETAPAIKEVLQARVNHGVFGYNIVPDSWKNAYVKWWKERHQFEINPDWLIFSNGVVPTISSVVRKVTTPGENVLMLTPVYNIFYNSILNNGRHVLESPLRYEDGCYSVDFTDLEEKMADPQTSLLLFCNPQNPTGNIWSKEELKRVGDLCKKYSVIALVDEIHCDLTDSGFSYVPYASASEECRQNSIVCMAPTKAFNIAGLQTSAVMVADDVLRHRVNRGLNTDEVAEPNSFAIEASNAAWNEGGQWLDALRQYLMDNKEYVKNYLKEHIPEIKVVSSHATYLMWLDCSAITDDTRQLCEDIRKQTGLYMSYGKQYGGNGNYFIRLNIACPRKLVEDGMNRLYQARRGK